MELDTLVESNGIAAYMTKQGVAQFTASAGQSVKIETSPGGEEICNHEVPAGKIWTVSVRLTIREEDA